MPMLSDSSTLDSTSLLTVTRPLITKQRVSQKLTHSPRPGQRSGLFCLIRKTLPGDPGGRAGAPLFPDFRVSSRSGGFHGRRGALADELGVRLAAGVGSAGAYLPPFFPFVQTGLVGGVVDLFAEVAESEIDRAEQLVVGASTRDRPFAPRGERRRLGVAGGGVGGIGPWFKPLLRSRKGSRRREISAAAPAVAEREGEQFLTSESGRDEPAFFHLLLCTAPDIA